MKTLILIPLMCFSQLAFSWSGTGHRIVCEIAYQELTSSTRKEVDHLISLDSGYSNFADSCNFPDRPSQRVVEHYVNFPRATEKVTKRGCPEADKCLFTAIRKDIRGIKDSSSTDFEKLEAIKFLGHWIGDLHQPLHVSFQDDRGGNEVRAKGRCRGSMHSIWDTCMIHARILEEPNRGSKLIRVAERLRSRITDAERDEWTRSRIAQWADESFQIAKSPTTGYCDQLGNKCIYEASSNRHKYAGGTKKVVTVNKSYMRIQEQIIRQRLIKAGVRLAYVLNNSL